MNGSDWISSSPDERFLLKRVEREYRNNEWLESDSIFDCERDREIIAMPPNHVLEVEWRKSGRFAVTVKANWLPNEVLEVLVDVPAETIILAGEEEAQPLPRFQKAALAWFRARREEQDRLARGTQDALATSPDGRIQIQYESKEMRMSLWVEVPHVFDVASGRLIFKPESSLVSGEHEWGESGQFTLDLREYPDGAFWVRLHFDIDAGTVRDDDDDVARPIKRPPALRRGDLRRGGAKCRPRAFTAFPHGSDLCATCSPPCGAGSRLQS